jgi:alkylation response protein AidB-like acyl-CoA dehydrogenase
MAPFQEEELLDSIRALTPTIRAECRDLDQVRAIPKSVVDSLRELGIFRLLAPKEVGAPEVEPVTFLRAVEEAAYADGSVGWCVMIGGCYSTFGGLLPPEGAKEIFGDETTITAGAFRPSGVARPVDGGYRVSGRWPLGSGSSHANWFIAGCAVEHEGQPASKQLREVLLPASDVEIIDTWDSTGLRGTASDDYVITDVYVPRHRAFWFSDPPYCDRVLYRMPVIGLFATYIGAVPLGIGRHALDEFTSLAAAKKSPFGTSSLADRPVVHDAVGRAHTALTAGRIYLTGAIQEVWDKVQSGRPPSATDHGSLWVAATYAAHRSLEAINALYSAAGSSSVYTSCGLDRCLRDARTAAQHLTVQEGNFEHLGRVLLGAEGPPPPWIMTDYRGS